VHRVGARNLLAAGLTGSAVGGLAVLAAVIAGAGLAALLVGLFVVVASVGLVMPNAAALALQDHGEHAGSAAALLGFSQFLIGGALAPLAGAAGATNALPMAVTIAALGAASLLVFAVLTRNAPGPEYADTDAVAHDLSGSPAAG
jgi:DHA1 family bicyclomycin/chloramphenicol resistance-like MFS transporter